MSYCTETARAAALLERVNRALILDAGERHQGHRNRAPGARLPVSVAGGRVALEAIAEPRAGVVEEDGRRGLVAAPGLELVTPVGYKTARRRLPRILADLDKGDPRLEVVRLLVDASERIGAVKGALSDGGGGGFDGQNDGGATTRVKHAARLRLIEARVNGWTVERGGAIKRGPQRVALPVQRARGNRREIRAFPAICALCVEGRTLGDVLRGNGWQDRRENRKPLRRAVLAALDDAAEGLGLGRWDAE
ncbi:hypothetical protein KUV64_22075 [Mameliella alba]|uniref:hypothetical protein n=1 Tax=Mameliella alba TaxID=561184 RepID=UPI001C94361F|nr:hypothetical protein [Mameliella alba]MBY6121826.1 hypothetical protein [Mameliella alba]